MPKTLKIERNIFQKEIRDWLDDPDADQTRSAEDALNKFAKSQAVLPDPQLKNKILSSISLLNKKRIEQGIIDIKNPPILTKDSNLYDWMIATKDMKAPSDFNEIHLEPIRSDEKVEMFVAWVSTMVPEEVHHDLLESFLLLEGTCTCHIKDTKGNMRVVNMQAGDYITMELGETHDVYITSGKPAKAVLQWLKIAA